MGTSLFNRVVGLSMKTLLIIFYLGLASLAQSQDTTTEAPTVTPTNPTTQSTDPPTNPTDPPTTAPTDPPTNPTDPPTTSSTDLPTTSTEPATTTAPCVDRDSRCAGFKAAKPRLFRFLCWRKLAFKINCQFSCDLCDFEPPCRDIRPRLCRFFQRRNPQRFQMLCQDNSFVQRVCRNRCGLCPMN